MKKHNFNAGPSVLPDIAVENTAKALVEFAGTGMSLASISHRSKEYEAVNKDAQSLIKEILSIPDGYQVLYLQGGASLQFTMVPYCLLQKKAVYLNTGTWASKALKEAELFGQVVQIKGKDFFSIPKGFEVDKDADYFHFTSNNTIYGTEWLGDFNLPVPVVCDMSSDILSRPIDISKYALIYAGAQKNMGPSGATLVIVKESVLGKVDRKIPSMLDYRTHIKETSLYNTPCVIAVYMVLETLKWVQANGGIKGMDKRAAEKSKMIYDEIDRNPMFKGTVAKEDRSRMNACFLLEDKYKELEEEFMNLAKSKGIVGIKGHRSVGGFRASIYNALSYESVEVLVNAMKEFEKMKA